MPPCLHAEALKEFTDNIRHASEYVVGTAVDDRGWEQAKLSIKTGGLGLRSTEEHASAAYLASRSSVKELCIAMNLAYSVSDEGDNLHLSTIVMDFRARILPDAIVDLEQGPKKQKTLSKLADARSSSSWSSTIQQILLSRLTWHFKVCKVPEHG